MKSVIVFFGFLWFGLAAGLPLVAGNQAEMLARPNIVVILADDLGYGDLSSYGAQDLRSPHVDALVKRGMRFDTFYANCPVCSPTRASLLTGRYPELVGVPGVIRTHAEDSWGYLAEDAVMLPQLLGQAGYTTAMVGKWHLGLEAPNRPNDRGFDRFRGFLGDMMDDYYTHRRFGQNYMRDNQRTIDPAGHATDLFTDWACDDIRQLANQGKPFFLYLAYNAPHTPIQPPQDWLDRVKAREDGISDRRAKLVALIEHMDEGIGRVVKTIEEQGIAGRTLIIFTSDNGGQLNAGANNGPLRDGKQSMYEGGLRVPCCVVWPGTVPAGSRGSGIWLTMDLFPTLCEIANAKISGPIEGRSLLPTLLGKEQPRIDRDVFFHRREGNLRYNGLTIQAVRRGDWKLLANSPYAPYELYNLQEDPLEANDLREKRPKVYRQLASALRLQLQRGGAVPWQPPGRRNVQ
jgi:arylsulfatase A-like enzyme